jgi:hypothetical protein
MASVTSRKVYHSNAEVTVMLSRVLGSNNQYVFAKKRASNDDSLRWNAVYEQPFFILELEPIVIQTLDGVVGYHVRL